MHPAISLVIGGVQLHTTSYRLFMVLGVLATVVLGFTVARGRGLPWRRVAVALVAMSVAFPVGARLFDAATKTEIYRREPWRLWSPDLAGFSMFGGLILTVAVGVVACQLLDLDLPRMADAAMPGLGAGIALMRVGCFMAGCCYGTRTDLPWGVTFPRGSNAHLHQLLGGSVFPLGGDPLPVHPTQLYEALAALVAVGFVLWLFRRGARDGTAFLLCACWYSAFRLLNGYLRVPGGELIVPAWFYPALYGIILGIAGGALLWRQNHSSMELRRAD